MKTKTKLILLILTGLAISGHSLSQNLFSTIPDSSFFKITVDTSDKNELVFKIDHIEKIEDSLDRFDIDEKMDMQISNNEILGCILTYSQNSKYGTRIMVKSGLLFPAEIFLLTNDKVTGTKDSLTLELEPTQDFIILTFYSDRFSIDSVLEITIKETEEEIPNSYQERLVADTINGVYIPFDIYDCINQLDSFWSDSIKAEHKSMSEEEFVTQTHFGMGLSIRNSWGLWKGSRLSKYFNDIGISHPDYMSSTILKNYHRHLNGLEIDMNVEEVLYMPDSIKKY